MKIEQLEALARTSVGDGKAPQLFFVSTERHGVVTVSRSLDVAYSHWQALATRNKDECPTLEDRLWGTIASVERDEDQPHRYHTHDDVIEYRRRHTLGLTS